ncbi:MAG TPA: TRAP transporter substrate-binding protein DctP [Dehalococcoidia bacterium]|nr:TRAP transporter substrate-binding protein DctP [Dehalococcoidia bacterium]
MTWKYQGHPPVADRYHEVVKRAAAKITTMSNGRLVVEPYAGGAIYPATEELYGVDAGILEMGLACPMYNLDKFPQASLFDMMSGGLTPLQMFLWHIRGGGDELAARMWEPALNVKYIASGGHLPPEIWCHSNRELKTPADIEGLKMRCAGEGGEILARMGAATVYFPGAELYESMQRGVIDAFEYASPSLNWGMGFQEVADYLYISPSRAPTDCGHVWVNRDVWEEITPDLQMIVEEAVRTTGFDYYAETVVLDDEFLVNFIDYGVEVLLLPKSIEDEILKVAFAYYDEKCAEDPFYAEIVESMRAFKAICDKQDVR